MHFSGPLVAIFGMFGLERALHVLFSNQVIEKKYQKVTTVVFFKVLFMLDGFFLKKILILLILNVVFFLISPMIMQVKEFFIWRNHEQELIALLDLLVVKISSGGSLKQALGEVQMSKNHVQHVINEIKHVISTNSDVKVSKFRPHTEKIAHELRKIDQSGFKTLEKIKNLRHFLRTQIYFQQKLSQATLQIRWQSTILFLLYTCLVVFVCINYSWKDIEKWLAFSLLLFFSGLIANWSIGRGFKWKV